MKDFHFQRGGRHWQQEKAHSYPNDAALSDTAAVIAPRSSLRGKTLVRFRGALPVTPSLLDHVALSGLKVFDYFGRAFCNGSIQGNI